MQQHSGQIGGFTQLVVQCHAGGTEQYVLMVLRVNLAVMVIPSGQTADLPKRVV
jgi:hypothetical protein